MNAVGKLAVCADGILVATVLPEVPNDCRLLDVHERTLALDPRLATTRKVRPADIRLDDVHAAERASFRR
jgi:hypothetical protein